MNLQDRALLVSLCIESWGTTRQDKDANRAVAEAKNSKESATRVSKRLAPEDALKLVKSKAEEARKHVRSVTQPWNDEGARLLDAAALLPLQAELRRTYQPAWQAEVDKVIARLDYFRDTWGPLNLGDLYDVRLYPTPAKMKKEFRWKLDVLAMNPDSKDVRMILGNEFVDQIQREAEARCNAQLAERIAAPLENMVRRLTDPEGKFMDTLVTNVADIATLIPALNLTGDARFVALQRQIEELTRHNAQTLRRSTSARNDTAKKAQAILDRMADFLPSEDNPNLNLNPDPADDTLDLIAPPASVLVSDLPLLAPLNLNPTPALNPAPVAPSWRQRFARR